MSAYPNNEPQRHEAESSSPQTPKMLKPADIAARLDCARETLVRWRAERRGPPFIQTGRLIRYPAQAFEDWLARGGDDGRMGGAV